MLGKRKRKDEKDVISTMPEGVLENMLTYLDNQSKLRFSQTSTWIRDVVLRFGKVKFYFTEAASDLFYNDQDNIRSRVSGKYLCVQLCRRDDVVNLSCLENVQEVKLIRCHNVRNVYPLRNCKYVYVEDCSALRDISSLGNVNKLYISEDPDTPSSQGIFGFSSLGKVKDLELHFCGNLSDTNLLHFVNIPKLKIFWCENITSVSCLANNEYLDFYNCYQVTDFESLDGVPTLSVSFCSV